MLVSINVRLWADPLSASEQQALNEWPNWVASTGCSDSSGGTVLVGSDNLQKVLNYLTGKGLTAMQAAGIMGNLMQEAGQGLDPSADQRNGKASQPTPGDGFGIAQWTDSGRQQGLVSMAHKENKPANDLGVQLDYLWQELTTTYAPVLQHLKSTTSVADAVNQFVGPNNTSGQAVPPTYEGARSGGYEDPGQPDMQNRLQYANEVLKQYGGTAGASSGSCGGSVACNNGGVSASSANLSSIRQSVVCLAQQELALWKSQPGYGNPYPNFKYAQTGYLKYTQNRAEEWCADFVSWIYKQAGDPLQQPDWDVPAVVSIQSIGQQNGSFHWHSQSSGYTPKPGDIAIHLAPGISHVNIYISSSGGTAQYIGGDQGSGPYPGGSIVSIETGHGYYDNGITGYVSPD